MKQGRYLFLGAALALLSASTAFADSTPTALELAKKGNDYVGVQSRDKVVEIYSDKSVASLTPTVWHVVYYDPDTPFRTVEVKFGAGQELETGRPVRPFHVPGNGVQVLDRSKINVDSDRALSIAAGQPLVKPLTLRAARLTLTHDEDGVVWKVQLWAAKLTKPDKDADIGTVTLSAGDGTVLRSDLHPGRAD